MSMPLPSDVANILVSLTLDEKISLLAGKNFWETVDIPEKGVPSVKTSDGPNGARGGTFFEGTTAALFPASVLLAASWDADLVRRVGNALAEETMTKGSKVLLAPTVCPHRHPLGGRNFESFSEEPLLAGKLATQYVHGLQEKGVGATIKHFAANEQETERFTMNANISERALREIYLKPFEIAIKESNPWAVMTSYNRINGVHADMNEWLLKDVLKEQWGWSGLIMSDWGGTNSTVESLNAGLDLEMPGPAARRKVELVKEAIGAGKVTEATIDERAGNVLSLLEKTGRFKDPVTPEEQAIDKPEHRSLIREAGGKGITLLKNEDGILPVRPGPLGKVAVFGLAKTALAHGGGSAAVNAHYKVTPWEALERAIGPRASLVYAEGAHAWNTLPVLSRGLITDDGEPGLTLSEWSESDSTSGSPTSVRNQSSAGFTTFEERRSFVTLTGYFTPSESGSHHFQLSSLGKSRLYIDENLVIDVPSDNSDPMAFFLGGSAGTTVQIQLTAGTSYAIRIETLAPEAGYSDFSLFEGQLGVNLGFMLGREFSADVLPSAVELAKSADICLIFTGNTTAWETEGRDMIDMRLPDSSRSQDKLIEGVAAVNNNVVVINSTGVAVETDPWIDSIKAFVQAWFPGQEAGNAIVDVLTGAANPGGKLPISWPKKVTDCPAYGNFPGDVETLQVNYAEDIFIGYRHFDRHPESLRFAFGYGLSYTTFALSNAGFSASSVTTLLPTRTSLSVSVTVENTGELAGSEVVQVYVSPLFATRIPTPLKTLATWSKVYSSPGESNTLEVEFDAKHACAYWNDRKWIVEQGTYDVIIATSARTEDEVWKGAFQVETNFEYDP